MIVFFNEFLVFVSTVVVVVVGKAICVVDMALPEDIIVLVVDFVVAFAIRFPLLLCHGCL